MPAAEPVVVVEPAAATDGVVERCAGPPLQDRRDRSRCCRYQTGDGAQQRIYCVNVGNE